jgi:release factor glutamine methyltransferase
MSASANDLLRDARERLPQRTGIPDPGREARFLLAAAWGRRASWLFAHGDAEVPADVAARFATWVERRAAGEPAEHLTGECEFWGRSFAMSPAVLVPRPETELVVEAALALPIAREARVLDVGTGSGCLAVTLAAERPRWRVAAVDRSLAALQVARANAIRHAPGVAFLRGDLATAVAPPWDLVVANLPYVPSPAMASLPVEVRCDPASALDGGPDGLDLVRRLLSDLSRVLRVCGGAILELGEDQAEAVAAAARADGLNVARRIRDLGGCERVVVLEPR